LSTSAILGEVDARIAVALGDLSKGDSGDKAGAIEGASEIR
jgi:hypothetical protein